MKYFYRQHFKYIFIHENESLNLLNAKAVYSSDKVICSVVV